MELIEREALIQAIEDLKGNCDSRFYNEAIIDCVSEAISAPTIDPIKAAGGCYCRECKHWCVSTDKTMTWCSILSDKETV